VRTIPAINLVVCGAAIVLGVFFFATPEQAAKLWGQRSLADMPHGAVVRRLYRVTGALLCLAGLLVAIEGLYHPVPAPVIRVPRNAPVTRLIVYPRHPIDRAACDANVKVCV